MISVVKIGGNIIDDPEALTIFLRDFAALEGEKILVHGGGKEATRLSKALGIETVMLEGRRVTDRETLDVVTMVYAGLISKRIVAQLQGMGCNAIGLCGADGAILPATRRSPEPVDYGFVGDIDPKSINVELIASLLEGGLVPVFSAICYDGRGGLLNCNADSVANALAEACSRMATTRLTFCFELPGVMENPDDVTTVIPRIDEETFHRLRAEGKIAGGMVPKIHNALKSARNGVDSVRICRAKDILGSEGTTVTQ